MCQPFNHEDPLMGIATEICSASSALNMPAEEIPDTNDQQYISERFVMAKHAMEHLHAALDCHNRAFREREQYRHATLLEKAAIDQKRQTEELIAQHKLSNKVKFFTKKWCKYLLLDFVELACIVIKILTLHKWEPSWHFRLLFSKFMEDVD